MGIRESLLNTITSVGSSDFVRIVTSAGVSSKATVQNLFKSFETGLGAKSSLGTSDYVRVVGSDDVAYKQSLSSIMNAIGLTTYEVVSGSDLITKLKSLTVGTYFYRMDNVSGFPITGGVVFRIVKTHGVTDTRASIIAIPMDSTANVYTAFVPASASSITWTAQPTRAEVDALNSKTYSTLTAYDGRVEDYTPAEADSSRVVTCGNVATVYFNVVYLKTVTSSQTSILSLPSGIKPKYNTYSTCVNRTSGKVYPLQISSTGNVNVMSGGQVAIGDQMVGQATFVID